MVGSGFLLGGFTQDLLSLSRKPPPPVSSIDYYAALEQDVGQQRWSLFDIPEEDEVNWLADLTLKSSLQPDYAIQVARRVIDQQVDV